MHGKILRYSNQTRNGVIINVNKKIFELRLSNWHDRKMMPATGMLVEFRLDESGQNVADCHASAYQSFPEGGLLKETDFWRTDTDEELRSKESDARAEMAKTIFEETDYSKLSEIEISMSIQDTIKEYFREELNTIASIESMMEGNDAPNTRLNYLIIKPYLLKAVDFLVFNDRHITADDFADDMQLLKRLEFSYKQFQTNVNFSPDKIYQESFLDMQHHYKGVLKAIEGFNEQKLSLANRVRVASMEIRSAQSKIEAKKGDINELEAKKQKAQNTIQVVETELNNVSATIDRLKGLADEFKKDNLTKFESVFKQMYESLVNKIKYAMDTCATLIDDKLWRLGSASVAIKNVFLKQNTTAPFCAMTFLGNQVRMLDKSKIKDNSYVLYQYYTRYVAKNAKYFLIFSSNQDFALELKVKIMATSKFYNVAIFHKETEYFGAVNKQLFECVYIDAEMTYPKPTSIIKTTKESKLNKDSNIALLSLNQIKDIVISAKDTPTPSAQAPQMPDSIEATDSTQSSQTAESSQSTQAVAN